LVISSATAERRRRNKHCGFPELLVNDGGEFVGPDDQGADLVADRLTDLVPEITDDQRLHQGLSSAPASIIA